MILPTFSDCIVFALRKIYSSTFLTYTNSPICIKPTLASLGSGYDISLCLKHINESITQPYPSFSLNRYHSCWLDSSHATSYVHFSKSTYP